MRFLFGVFVGFLILPVLIYCYFRLGIAPVASKGSTMPFERGLAKMALHTRIQREYQRQVPFKASDSDLQKAAHLYRTNCAVCHGLPGSEDTPTAKGMFPEPPQLFRGKGVTDDDAGESYWKVANGIRLTGMPAYRGPLSEHDMWSISELLAGADKLPPDVRSILEQPIVTQ